MTYGFEIIGDSGATWTAGGEADLRFRGKVSATVPASSTANLELLPRTNADGSVIPGVELPIAFLATSPIGANCFIENVTGVDLSAHPLHYQAVVRNTETFSVAVDVYYFTRNVLEDIGWGINVWNAAGQLVSSSNSRILQSKLHFNPLIFDGTSRTLSSMVHTVPTPAITKPAIFSSVMAFSSGVWVSTKAASNTSIVTTYMADHTLSQSELDTARITPYSGSVMVIDGAIYD